MKVELVLQEIRESKSANPEYRLIFANRSSKAWQGGSCELANSLRYFAQRVRGGSILSEGLHDPATMPMNACSANVMVLLKAHRSWMIRVADFSSRLHLIPGRYRVWIKAYGTPYASPLRSNEVVSIFHKPS